MGAGICREESIEVAGAGGEAKEKSKDAKFWHEKMRFSHASQSLFDAAVRGDAGLAAQAVRGLGDPNCCSGQGIRPLQVAISCGNRQLVELLLKAGADINGHTKGTPPPLVLAASTDDTELFDLLLGQGADLSVADDSSGETALTRASARGHFRIVQAILGRGTPGFQKLLAQRSRLGPQGDGATALHLAASHGFRDICDRLLGVGADPSATDRRGRMALHHAAEGNHVEVANLLLTFGSKPSGPDEIGNSPLHLAAERGFLTLADVLVRFSADVNASRRDGRVPAHMAAKGGHDVICKLLLEQKAEPNAVDATGEPPFVLAFREAHVRCCRALLDAGAEVSAVEGQRWEPPYSELGARDREQG